MVQSPGVVYHLATRFEFCTASRAGDAAQPVVGFSIMLLERLACRERCPADWASSDLLLIRQLVHLAQPRTVIVCRHDDHRIARDRVRTI